MRLTAHADPALWIPVTDSLGWRGRRHRKAAIRMLLGQASSALGAEPRPGSRLAAWAMSQAAPLAMRKADGRFLAWTWKAEPEFVVAMANVQQLTPQLRAARAMMPMEYDDTEQFRSSLGIGEKLVMVAPSDSAAAPSASYTWDTGSHLITVNAIGSDRERFGTVIGALDDLARTLRITNDVVGDERPDVLRIDPS